MTAKEIVLKARTFVWQPSHHRALSFRKSLQKRRPSVWKREPSEGVASKPASILVTLFSQDLRLFMTTCNK